MSFSRREFLTASTGGALATLGLGALGGPGCGVDRGGPEKGLAVTMWEFSWLVRRSGAEAEYADWDRVLDELSARGYNAVRLDAFPHLLARGAGGERVDRFTIAPQSPLFFWGNHEPVEVEPRPALIEFLGKLKERGMRAGLSTWFNDDSLHRADEVVTPEDYARIWSETLDILAAEGLHDVIAWVDLCNEFPLPKWARGAYPAIFDEPLPETPIGMMGRWSDTELSRVQRYFDEAIPPLRAAYPELRYTFSFAAGFAGSNLDAIDTTPFDLAELHLWLSDDIGFSLESGQLALLLEEPDSLEYHVIRAPELYFEDRERLLRVLEAHLVRWKGWADARGLPLITTEAWGPINYNDVAPIADDTEWDWVKDVCAAGTRMASERGWEGICTSNFCQPQFPGMWADEGWHRELTRIIRGTPR